MTKQAKTRKPRLDFVLMPVGPTADKFFETFAKAKAKWPGVQLGYIGTAEDGRHYFEERGNPAPFILG